MALGAAAARSRSSIVRWYFGLSPRPPSPTGKCTHARPRSYCAARNSTTSVSCGDGRRAGARPVPRLVRRRRARRLDARRSSPKSLAPNVSPPLARCRSGRLPCRSMYPGSHLQTSADRPAAIWAPTGRGDNVRRARRGGEPTGPSAADARSRRRRSRRLLSREPPALRGGAVGLPLRRGGLHGGVVAAHDE